MVGRHGNTPARSSSPDCAGTSAGQVSHLQGQVPGVARPPSFQQPGNSKFRAPEIPQDPGQNIAGKAPAVPCCKEYSSTEIPPRSVKPVKWRMQDPCGRMVRQVKARRPRHHLISPQGVDATRRMSMHTWNFQQGFMQRPAWGWTGITDLLDRYLIPHTASSRSSLGFWLRRLFLRAPVNQVQSWLAAGEGEPVSSCRRCPCRNASDFPWHNPIHTGAGDRRAGGVQAPNHAPHCDKVIVHAQPHRRATSRQRHVPRAR
ncbi:hypothetical protein QFZ34_001137 [Phyllobacterium ifriqiyense]|uniref:Uncharacterized protein n=1 Tax=Phyllobacterium ifriqiyense TaxID=314238 RepID=A0ABU0S5D5_9HYPH|nr:hypothetical protein [Phyllobacterium ifriqiyense]